MTRLLQSLVILLICVLPMPVLAAADDQAQSERAYELSIKGEFDQALSLYDALIQQHPRAPELLYNAGTANLKAGHLGPAVLYLERALALDPDCDACMANLEQALTLQKDKVIVKPTDKQQASADLQHTLEGMNLDVLALLLLIAHLAAFLIYLLRRLAATERLRFSLSILLALLLLLDISFGGLALMRAYGIDTKPRAVVMAGEIDVLKGPNLNYPQAFTVHEGLVVRLGEQVEDWRQIWLPNGLNGYIPESDLARILP